MRLNYCAFGLLNCVLFSANVAAQDRLETITITTMSLHEEGTEAVGHVTRLNRDDIVKNLGANLGDSLTHQPGVSATQFGQGASRPILRGLGSERVLVLTNGLGVIDASAASPDHQVSSDGLDAQSIEILRGPEALAYGGQAVGGVVNVLDDMIGRPQNEDTSLFNAVAFADSVNDGNTVSGRIEDQFGAIRAVISISSRDLGNYEIPGFAESSLQRALEAAEEEGHDDDADDADGHSDEEAYALVENSFAQNLIINGGLTWSNDTSFFGISIRQQNADYGIIGHAHEEGHDEEGEEHDDGDDHAEEEEAPFIDLEQTRFEARGEHTFDRDSGLTRIDFGISAADYTHTEFEAPGEAGSIYEVNGLEGRVNGYIKAGAANYIVGANYVDTSLSTAGEEAFLPSTDSETIGAYILRHWGNDSGLDIDGGIRLETTTREAATGMNASFTALSAALTGAKSFDGTVKIGLQIALSQRAPNENELFANGEHLATQQFELGDVNLDLESNLSIEATVRKTLDNWGIGGNVYVNSFSDFIYLTSITDPNTDTDLPIWAYTQRDAEFLGGELYLDHTSSDAFLGADITTEIGVDFVSATFDDGADVPLMPPARLLLGTNMQWDIGTLYVDLILASEQDAPGTGRLATPGYAKLDIGGELPLGVLSQSLAGMSVFVKAENVFDEEIRTATSYTKDLAPQAGKNFKIGLKARF